MSSHHAQITLITEKLEEWDYKLDRLEHRLRELPESVKQKSHEKLEQLRDKRKSLVEKKAALQSGAGDAAQGLEESLEAVWGGAKLLLEEIELEVNVECS